MTVIVPVYSQAERIVAFYVPIGAVFARIGFVSLMGNQGNSSRGACLRKLAVPGVVVAIVVVTVLNSEVPALYFHASPPKPYYWASNDLSSVGVYKVTGSWTARYAASNSTYITEFDTAHDTFLLRQKTI